LTEDVEPGGLEPLAPDPIAALNRTIRRSLVPEEAPRVRGYEIAAGTMFEEDGRGDTVWDAFPLADGRSALVCFHVREAGFPPAHHLAVTRTALRCHAEAGAPVSELMARANDTLVSARGDAGEQAVDAAVFAVGAGLEEIEWSAAGWVSGALIRRAGTLDPLRSHGPPLGVMAGFRYGSTALPMHVGDSALVVSRVSEGLFRGAADLVASLEGRSSGDAVGTLYRALRKSGEGAGQEVSVILVRRRE